METDCPTHKAKMRRHCPGSNGCYWLRCADSGCNKTYDPVERHWMGTSW